MCVSGSYEPPAQFVPPAFAAKASVASGPSHLLTTGGVKTGPSLYRDAIFKPSARSCGVKSMMSSVVNPWASYAGGFVGNGCVGEYHSPGTVPFSTALSSKGQIG